MKFPNLHIVWTAGKNLALPDTLSRNTPPELLTKNYSCNTQEYKILPCRKRNITPTRMQICSKN